MNAKVSDGKPRGLASYHAKLSIATHGSGLLRLHRRVVSKMGKLVLRQRSWQMDHGWRRASPADSVETKMGLRARGRRNNEGTARRGHAEDGRKHGRHVWRENDEGLTPLA